MAHYCEAMDEKEEGNNLGLAPRNGICPARQLNPNERRIAVQNAFEAGLVSKFALDDPAPGLQKLQEAYDLARSPTLLPGLWPSITAYRLAHLKFRVCRNESELRYIDGLLKEILDDEAAVAELKIGASVMRVATLHRLHSLSPATYPAWSVQNELERSISLRNDHFDLGGYTLDPRVQPAQEPWLNLIELASYFTGGDTSSLRRRGVRPTVLPNMGAKELWYIVGSQGLTSDLLYTETLATAELKALAKANEFDVVFRAENDKGEMLHPLLPKRRKGTGPSSIPKNAYKAMALACFSDNSAIWETEFTDFGVNASRVREALGSALAIDDPSLFGSPGYDGVYKFRSDLRVAAMIKADCLDGWARRLASQ